MSVALVLRQELPPSFPQLLSAAKQLAAIHWPQKNAVFSITVGTKYQRLCKRQEAVTWYHTLQLEKHLAIT